jgi:hypothetical protein
MHGSAAWIAGSSPAMTRGRPFDVSSPDERSDIRDTGLNVGLSQFALLNAGGRVFKPPSLCTALDVMGGKP